LGGVGKKGKKKRPQNLITQARERYGSMKTFLKKSRLNRHRSQGFKLVVRSEEIPPPGLWVKEEKKKKRRIHLTAPRELKGQLSTDWKSIEVHVQISIGERSKGLPSLAGRGAIIAKAKRKGAENFAKHREQKRLPRL